MYIYMKSIRGCLSWGHKLGLSCYLNGSCPGLAVGPGRLMAFPSRLWLAWGAKTLDKKLSRVLGSSIMEVSTLVWFTTAPCPASSAPLFLEDLFRP